jgi:hypothetical protein
MLGRHVVAARIVIAVLAPAGSFAAGSGDGHSRGSVNARERRQTVRIREGVETGAITRGELNRLRADEAAIRAEERLYRRAGVGLNRYEHRDLRRDLNRASREIYRTKHNRRVRD